VPRVTEVPRAHSASLYAERTEALYEVCLDLVPLSVSERVQGSGWQPVILSDAPLEPAPRKTPVRLEIHREADKTPASGSRCWWIPNKI